jgi:hypothetical protein
MSASHCFKVRLMWVPAHVGILGNEMVSGIAKGGAKSVLYCFTVAVGCNFYTQIKFHYLTEWEVCFFNFFSCAAPDFFDWKQIFDNFLSDVKSYSSLSPLDYIEKNVRCVVAHV